jgi:hypothetical protein
VSTITTHARAQPTELPPDTIEEEDDEEDEEDDEYDIVAFASLTNGLRHHRQLTSLSGLGQGKIGLNF